MNDEFVRDVFDSAHAAHARRVRLYEELVRTRKLKSHLLLTYRGRNCRCALLHILDTTEGVLVGHPPGKVSTSRAMKVDGTPQNRTKRAAFLLRDSPGPERFGARCDHVSEIVTAEQIRADLAANRRGAEIQLP
ncbi:hypothetical protein [Antrihabitans stalactiti]|uniref:Uncharacterized protein n=1 Tax=Antrihabitans stalactiti TaxID=2584121 RepID=A0A848K9E0_9NOCA|nr:hypothetical protein [Antrihabitans stalactiti]NMN93904.1 hypothetical protein [Antrihabitans stalactiti]